MKLPERTNEIKDTTYVHIGFEIDTTGRVRDVQVLGIDRWRDLTALEVEAIRVVEKLPTWQPARLDDVPIRCLSQVTVPFIYRTE